MWDNYGSGVFCTLCKLQNFSSCGVFLQVSAKKVEFRVYHSNIHRVWENSFEHANCALIICLKQVLCEVVTANGLNAVVSVHFLKGEVHNS